MVASDVKAESLRLMDKRAGIEEEIATIVARLTAPGAPGLTGNLIDAEGYPRSDIDIMAVRADRHRLAVLHTDHKEITNKIEANIHILHSAASTLPQKRPAPEEAPSPPARSPPSTSSSPSQPSSSRAPPPPAPKPLTSNPYALTPPQPPSEPTPMDEDQTEPPPPIHNSSTLAPAAPVSNDTERLAPFAVIDEVQGGSPGESDGLRVGDLLLRFGEVVAGPDCVARVAGELQRGEGQALPVVISRRGAQSALVVRPRRWAGRGLLGCHMRPI